MQLSMSVFISQAIYVAAKLGIADLLARRTKVQRQNSAAVTETNEGALYRVLRSSGQRRRFLRKHRNVRLLTLR
jgi:hypothetical protein